MTIYYRLIQGQSASAGVVIGKAVVESAGQFINPVESHSLYTVIDFDRAIMRTHEQLVQFQQSIQERITESVTQIFAVQHAILDDVQFTGKIRKLIEEGSSAVDAINTVWQHYTTLFTQNQNPHFREKTQDLTDLTNRILTNLTHPTDRMHSADYHGAILIMSFLFPSDILRLVAQNAEGVIFTAGGVTAHTSILARSLELPMIFANAPLLHDITAATLLLLDANQGMIHVNPNADVIAGYKLLLETHGKVPKSKHSILPQTHTKDGRRIRLMAAIGLASEANIAREMRAEGIGLYRSEMPFLIRNGFPTEDEQYAIYRRIIETMAGDSIVFRTLDIGGDKILRYFPIKTEANPFLGLRGIRLIIRHQEIFNTQVRALLRASFDRPLKILLPLVPSPDSFLHVKAMLRSILADLKTNGIPHQATPEVGAMIELPCAVLMANELAAEADFLSIGTNDLVQYMLAIDRTNEEMAGWYAPWHPSILRAIALVVDASHKHNKPVSVCGDMATMEALIPILIGMGLQDLTIPPNLIPQLQRQIGEIDSVAAAKLAQSVMASTTVQEAATLIGLTWKPVWEEECDRTVGLDVKYVSNH